MVATSVQQSENTPVVTDSAAIVPSGHHTLATEEYAKVLALLGKQDMDVTHNLDTPHNSYLAGKPFCLLTSFNDTNWITMPNGRQTRVHHIGTMVLSKDIILKDVFHVLDFHFNLLSASKIAKHLSSYVIFSPNLCFIQDPLKNRQVVLGKERCGLYFVNTSAQFTSQVASLQPPDGSVSCMTTSEIWHYRLGHPSSHHMTHILALPCKPPTTICSICPLTK